MGITLNPKSLDYLKKTAKEFRPAALRALNKTARMVEVEANRQIRQQYNLTRTEVDASISGQAASISKLTAIIRASGKRFPLIRFAGKQTKVGTPVSITRGRRVVIKGAFITSMKTGHVGIFKRLGASRLPIKELRTISVAEMFAQKANQARLVKYFVEKLPDVLMHEIRYFISQKAQL